MAIAAQDPTDRVEQLIVLTDRLTSLLAAQAQAFEQRRPHEAAAQVEEIGRLANIYRHESARVKGHPQLVASAPPELRRRLMQATEAFDAVLARHGRAVNAARVVTEGLVRAIADEVTRRRTENSGYGPGAVRPAATGAATAITLNRRA